MNRTGEIRKGSMRILAVDTSSRMGSVAVVEGETVTAELSATSGQTHAKRLLSAVIATLDMACMGLEDCDGFAVTTGPGSFTGLRIGISTVKGLAFAARKPVTGVSSLDALAAQFPLCRHTVCPMVDAGKGQVYTTLYEMGPHMERQRLVDDCAVDPGKWLKSLHGACLFVGDGAGSYRDLIRNTLGAKVHFAPPYLNMVRASVVGSLGLKQIREGLTVDIAALKPHYIRKSDAELKVAPGLRTDESC